MDLGINNGSVSTSLIQSLKKFIYGSRNQQWFNFGFTDLASDKPNRFGASKLEPNRLSLN